MKKLVHLAAFLLTILACIGSSVAPMHDQAMAGYTTLLGSGSLSLSRCGPTPPAGIFSVGINITGAQNSIPSFPSSAAFTYYSAKNIRQFRFPIAWATPSTLNGGVVGIQTTAFGPLDTTSTAYSGPAGNGTSYVAQMNAVISNVMNACGQVLIDIHEFGAGPGGSVGSMACPTTCFADLWGKIASYYVNIRPDLLPGIYGLDLMNEWVNGFDSSIIFTATQQAITAIRSAGYNGPLYIEGTNFSSAWNWTSGEGNPFNNSNLYQLIDPQNNLISSAHMYPDPSDSGSLGAQTFSYSVALTTPGTAPTGLDLNPTIGNTRTTREWLPWLNTHSLRGHIGEYGTSTDSPWIQGNFDYADWNLITKNLLDLLQANNIEISLWASGNGGAGYGPVGYGYSLDPFNSNLLGQSDFSTRGVQAPAWVLIDKYTGFTGAQPQAYALFKPGLSTPNLYTTVGVASQPFNVYYGGHISSPVTITPHAILLDGTNGGGTFTPTTLTLGIGDNAIASFTYTPSQSATFQISTTNNVGWFDPPTIGFSSEQATDPYAGINYTAISNIYGMYNRLTPNIGPSLRLQRVSDNQQMDWGFTLLGNGYAQFDRGAIQAWAAARIGIPIVTIHSIGLLANDIICTGSNLPTLNLQNAAGYPEIVIPSGAACEFNTPVPGVTALSTIARMNQTTAGAFFRMDWFVGPLVWLNSGFQIFSTGCLPNGQVGPPAQGSINTTLNFSAVNGAYHEYGASYASGVTNGFQTYKDGSQIAQATITYTLSPCFAAQQAEFVHFKNGPQPWVGSFTNFELTPGITYSPAQQAAIATMDATYYSTPLPDALPAVPPTITNVLTNLPIYPGIITARPFGALSITDSNSGPPMDTVTITLSGAAGTLSGSGISGTGPYTVGPDTPANVTSIMNKAVFTTATGIGSTSNFAINVVSSAGSSNSNSATSTIVATWTQATFTPPVGTFTPVNHSGYNLAGAELGSGCPTCAPQPYQLDYMASKSFGLMRYVISSKFLYTSAFGQLDSSYLSSMKAIIDYAFTKNIYIVIDIHDGSGVWDASFGAFRLTLPSMRGSDLFQDAQRRLGASFKNYPNVIFGMLNEPSSISATDWRDGGVTPALIAIRAAGATQLILIPGVGDGAIAWASQGNASAFAGYTGDPLNNFAFEVHQYLDSSASGASPVSTINGSTVLSTFNTFLSANGFKGFIGEFGMSWDPWYPIAAGTNELFDSTMSTPQTTNNNTQYSAMLDSAIGTGNYVGWSQWGGGNEFITPPTMNGYFFQPEPKKASSSAYVIPLVEQPFISVLQTKVINFLLKRDIDPAANDNDPAFLEKAA